MSWFDDAKLGTECCNPPERCLDCKPDGFCESCETFEGRLIECINEYASTCDGCYQMLDHDLQQLDSDGLGYCENCRPELFVRDAK